jgi:hypothetical protein
MPLNQFNGDQIKDGSVTGDDIQDGSLVGEDFQDGSITADKLDLTIGDGIAQVYSFNFTLTGTNQDTWTGTQTQSGLLSTNNIVPGLKTSLSGTFILTVTDIRDDEFDWKLESFQGFTGGAVTISYVIG